MAVIWSATSFVYYMMQIYNKYLEGTILTNFLFDCFAGILSTCFTTIIYNKFSTRLTFAISFALALSCGCVIFLLECTLTASKYKDLDV